MKYLKSSYFSIGLLVVIWLIVRLPAFINNEPHMSVEVQQAHKLLEYGVKETSGAPLWTGATVGRLANPREFIYTHHPYPSFWVIAALYALGGGYTVLITLGLVKLAGCILAFKTLALHFSRTSAWLAAVMYAVAPAGMLEDYGASCVALSSIAWPFAAWLLVGRRDSAGKALVPSSWICAGLAFVASQIDWLALTLVPALLILTLPHRRGWKNQILELVRNPNARAILIGSFAGFVLFCLQVIFYHPNASDLMEWLIVKTGNPPATAESASKFRMLLLVAMRLVAFVGIPLVIGTLVGLCRTSAFRSRLALAAAVHFCAVSFLILVIPNYFYMERTVYTILLFPTAVWTAVALDASGRFLPRVLVVLLIPGILLSLVLHSAKNISPVSRQLAAAIAGNTRNTDLVLTNLTPGKFPYPTGDVVGGKATTIVADRRIFFSIENQEQLTDMKEQFKTDDSRVVFFVADSQPLSPELASTLDSHSQSKTTVEVAVPADNPSIFSKLRALAWYRIMRKGEMPVPGQTRPSISFTVYQTDSKHLIKQVR